jgi:glucokinase
MPRNTKPVSPTSSEFTYMGMDIGGTKIAAGLVSFPSGRVLIQETIPTLPARGGEAVLSDTVELARKLKDHAAAAGVDVQGIGIGIAELVSLEGEITSEYLIKWRGLPVREIMSQIAPARFESDARAPALGEALFGAGRRFRNFVYLTVGTGISYCLVIDGQPYAGAHGHAILVGSAALTSECLSCGAIQDQVLEDVASGPALVNRYNQRVMSTLGTGNEVAAAAANGDRVAEQILSSAGATLGNRVSFLINLLDPHAVIVGGGLGLAGGLYWDSLVSATRKHVWSDISSNLPIVRAELGENAGLVGAAATMWKLRTSQGQLTAQNFARD